MNKVYNPSDFGKEEEKMHKKFRTRLDDAKRYFNGVIKPRLDRSYKLYIAYTGDRQKEIKDWQANVFTPYIMAAVETLIPRILDARPEFISHGRSDDDQIKTGKQQQLMDYLWELSGMDKTLEDLVRSSLIYGTGFLQVSWKKDVREYNFLSTNDVSEKPKYKKEKKTFYDAPYCEWVDNYSLLYDWHNIARESKQDWFKRLILTEDEIKRKYPLYNKRRLSLAIESGGGDLTDYARVREEVKSTHSSIGRGDNSGTGLSGDRYNESSASGVDMYEVFEWHSPFEDRFAVMVGGGHVPILKGGSIYNPYDFKAAPFIEVPYLRLPGEFEGYGLPMILESPQLMLNLIKNQRLDSAKLSIHKMWIVNPLANINKEELVTRPFGIIYSVDPNGVREVEFSDIKQSAYREEDLLKQDMRYSSGIDDFSMGSGGGAGSATEVRHLRESTLERVRLFVNHLGDGLAVLMRYWMDMQRQFFTKKMHIRLVGEDGNIEFPLIEKDDLMGNFDYKAVVLPSIAGQQDVKKKQDMDLFQLLVSLPFIDPKKLTSKVLSSFGWNIDELVADEDPQQQMMGEDGMPMEGEMSPEEMMAMSGGADGMMPGGGPMPQEGAMPGGEGMEIPPNVLINALKMLGRGAPPAASVSHFGEMSLPVNLLQAGNPPTAKNVPAQSAGGGKGGYLKGGAKTTNLRGFNRGGKVDTNIPSRNTTPEGTILKNVNNTQ